MPRQKVKCIECFHEFSQRETAPGKHDSSAGWIDGKQFFNTECPNCGVKDRMSDVYVGVSDEILTMYKNGNTNLQVLIDYNNDELTEEEVKDRLK